MSVMLPKDADLLGVPLLKVRNLLQAWHRARGVKDIRQMSRKRGIELPPSTTAVLTEELRNRGFIGDETGDFVVRVRDGLTTKGRALASAKATVRTPKDKARKVFDGLLDAADRINARDDLPFRVHQIWLFGSMIDPEKSDVGDIDFCIDLERTPAFGDRNEATKRYWTLASEMGAPYAADAYDWVTERLLYGARRHQLLAPNHVDRVARMGCPCQLAYDQDRGGRVDDVVLSQHPTSTGRDPDMPEPQGLPDLTPPNESVDPVHIDLLTPSYLSRTVFAESHPSWTSSWSAARAWRAHDGRPPLIVASPQVDETLPALVDISKCDGRSNFAIFLESPEAEVGVFDRRPPGCALVISRSISVDEDGAVYRLKIDDYADGGVEPTEDMLTMARWILNACMEADIERIGRRSLEAGYPLSLDVELDAAQLGPATASLILDLNDDVGEVMQSIASKIGIAGVAEGAAPDEEIGPTVPAAV